MPRKLIVEVAADISQYVKSLKTGEHAAEVFAKEVTVDSRAVAKAQVDAAVKSTEALHKEAAAYRAIASAAEKGSKEQITAARLGASAQRRLDASLVGAAGSARKTHGESQKLGRGLEHVTRGAISGTGALQGFSRSLAFASGGFIAFEGVSRFLTDSINAAREAGVAQRSLAAQMKTSGESFDVNRERIEKVALSYGKFGFQNDAVIASLTVLERGTGNINKAISLQGLTADLARAKNLDLAKAATVVAKVFGGQETALRRAVPGLQKSAHGWDLIRQAQAKLAGQAAANTTVAERFAATLHDTEEIVGLALLPTLNKYLTQLSTWLDKMNQSGKLQEDVAKSAHALGVTFNFAADAIGKTVAAYGKLPDFGKHKGLIDILPGGHTSVLDLFHQLDRIGAAPSIDPKLEQLPSTLNAAAEASVKAAHGLGLVAEAVKKVGDESKKAFRPTAAQRNTWFDQMIGRLLGGVSATPTGAPAGLQTQLERLRDVAARLTKRIAATKDVTRYLNLESQLQQVLNQEWQTQQDINQKTADAAQAAKDKRQKAVDDMIAALEVNVARAGLTKTLSDDIAAQKKLVAKLRERVRATHGSAAAWQDLITAQGELNAKQEQAAQQRQERIAARQFRALGLGPTGDELTPGIKALRKQADAVRDAIAGTFLDTRKTKSMLAHIRTVLAGGMGQVGKDVRAKVKEILDGIQSDLKGAQGFATKYSPASPKAIMNALGFNLTPEQRKRMVAVLAQTSGGMVAPHRSQAFRLAGAGVTTIHIEHFHSSAPNVKALEDELTKRHGTRPHIRRGAR